MNEKLAALKLFLEQLGISTDISTRNGRKRVQKAVYLGQLSGVDLGYHFGWYLLGPYSPALTRDYFQLDEDVRATPDAFKGKHLRSDVSDKLKKVAPLFVVPPDLRSALSTEDWLELLASYHYLRTASGQDSAQAQHTMDHRKGHLSQYVDRAAKVLKQQNLLAA